MSRSFRNLSTRRQNQLVQQHIEEYPESYYESDSSENGLSERMDVDTGSINLPSAVNRSEENLEANIPSTESDLEEYDYFSYTESEHDSDEDIPDEDEVFLEDLAELALTHLPDYVTDKLLKVLAKTNKFKNLPKNHRGLLGDICELPRPASVVGGNLLHIGIRANLLLLPSTLELPEVLEADFSHDGVRLHKSSSTFMWPIVMSLHNLPEAGVRLISIFIGSKSRLSVHEFFHCLITELNEIYDNDCMVEVSREKKRVKFNFRLSTADTPAKTFGLGETEICMKY